MQPLWGRSEFATGRRERWEQRTGIPLAVLAVVFLAAFCVPGLWPSIPQSWKTACRLVEDLTYACFVIDYVVRWWLSRNKVGFIRHSLLDLVILVLPMLRPLRTLRLVALLQMVDRRLGRSLRGQVILYLALVTALVLFVASVAVLDVERYAPGTNLRNFSDTLWWATTTITTVGYGEHHPVTQTGRIIAACLMFTGIALLGTVTASIAAWMFERLRQDEDEIEAETLRDVEAIQLQLAQAREEIQELKQLILDSRADGPRP